MSGSDQEVRLVPLTGEQVERINELAGAFAISATSETASKETRDERFDSSMVLLSIVTAYEDGIDEATVIGSYLCRSCHDKLHNAFGTAP